MAFPGFACPRCGDSRKGSEVIDSRARDGYVRRRRVCLACNGRFTTHEHVWPDAVVPVSVGELRDLRAGLTAASGLASKLITRAGGAVAEVVDD